MSDPKAPPTPPTIAAMQAAWGKATAFVAAVPRGARILIGTTVGAAVLIGGSLALRASLEPYTKLYAGLDGAEAGEITAKLRERKVPYRLSEAGATIEVPESRADEVRLDLAQAGLPGGGAQREPVQPGMIASDEQRRAVQQQMLEVELARTIKGIEGVKSARVHLALPKPSLFVRRSEAPTAAVKLDLRPGRRLAPQEIDGVVFLVANSVEGLDPSKITVVNSHGAILHKPSGGEDSLDDRGTAERELDKAALLEDRARSQLERFLGPDHVDVRVNVELDWDRVEQTAVRQDPEASATISEETRKEYAAPSSDAEGVPGPETNLPGGDGAAPPAERAAGGGMISEAKVVNRAPSTTTETRKSAPGTHIHRLSAAVLVDGLTEADGSVTPRSPEELDKVAALVRSAIGANDRRGDLVTVETATFALPAPEPPPAGEPASVLPPSLARYERYAPYAAAGVGAVVLLAGAVALARRKKSAPLVEAIPVPTATPQLTAPDPVKELPAANVAQEQRAEAMRRAASDPATAALVIRHWLGTVAEQSS